MLMLTKKEEQYALGLEPVIRCWCNTQAHVVPHNDEYVHIKVFRMGRNVAE